MDKSKIKKVVLAYSGGLDTSIIIPWLKENYNNCEVIAVSGDVGQGTELDGLEEKAKKTGASKLYIEDLNKEFVEDYIFPTVKAGAVYEGDYLLGTSFARPVIAKRIVEIALAEGADAICHGCTGKGNDQVRFEVSIQSIDPELKLNRHGVGKYLLRRAFAGEGLIPESIIWREKAAFSDAVGHSLADGLKALAARRYPRRIVHRKRIPRLLNLSTRKTSEHEK